MVGTQHAISPTRKYGQLSNLIDSVTTHELSRTFLNARTKTAVATSDITARAAGCQAPPTAPPPRAVSVKSVEACSDDLSVFSRQEPCLALASQAASERASQVAVASPNWLDAKWTGTRLFTSLAVGSIDQPVRYTRTLAIARPSMPAKFQENGFCKGRPAGILLPSSSSSPGLL